MNGEMRGEDGLGSWQHAISSTFYPQEAAAETGQGFAGILSMLSLISAFGYNQATSTDDTSG